MKTDKNNESRGEPASRGSLVSRAFAIMLCVCSVFALAGCVTVSVRSSGASNLPPPCEIMGKGAMKADRLVAFFMAENPKADRAKVRRMARYYIEEASAEGVNPDVAFVQMCLETGFLRFGGLVTVDMNNFCGLGSIGPGQSGNRFSDERTGVRAHVQHLKAYATVEPLAQEQVDPRYRYVNPKGKAPTVQGLAGTWAADRAYGDKLEGLIGRLYA